MIMIRMIDKKGNDNEKIEKKTTNNVTITYKSQILIHIRRKPSHYNHKYEKIHHKTTMIHN